MKIERVNNGEEELEQEDDGYNQTTDEIEDKVPSQLDRILYALEYLEKKSWRLIDAREGFNVYANLQVKAGSETQNLKSDILIVKSYIDILNDWTQSLGTTIVSVVLAATILLIANDFADQLKVYNHDGSHTLDAHSTTRLQVTVKIIASLFLVIGLLFAICEQRSKGNILKK